MKKLVLLAILLLSFNAFAESESDIEKYQAQVKSEVAARLKQGLDRELSEKAYAEAKASLAELAKKPNARIGMSASQVRNKTNWGKPYSINQTITANGTREQWVYGDEYLYFTNGRLTAIQTSR